MPRLHVEILRWVAAQARIWSTTCPVDAGMQAAHRATRLGASCFTDRKTWRLLLRGEVGPSAAPRGRFR